jgi:hypothetical protein
VSIYALKPRFQALLRPLAAALLPVTIMNRAQSALVEATKIMR